MAKNKKLQEKLRQYYRGPIKKPTKTTNEDEMKVISAALRECVPQRFKNAFKCQWKGRDVSMKLVLGLSSSLRNLKHKRTLALMFDSVASQQLTNLLVEFAHKQAVPVIKANGLTKLAPELGLKTLLFLSLVDTSSENKPLYKDSDPKPQPVNSTLDLQSFRDFAALLQGEAVSICDKYTYKPPQLDRVKSTGKSKAKKEARAAAKRLKMIQKGATT